MVYVYTHQPFILTGRIVAECKRAQSETHSQMVFELFLVFNQ